METMERSKRRSRRSSTGEFKTEIRSQCLAGEQSIPEVGQDFDLTVSALDKWLAQVEMMSLRHWVRAVRNAEELFCLRREHKALQAISSCLK